MKKQSFQHPKKPSHFLKWAGGKTQLLETISKYLPETFGRYFEPFLGSGALFFHLAPQKAVLCDSNEELITTYKVVRDNLEPLIANLKRHVNSEDHFYATRATVVTKLSDIQKASRLMYLNRTCFNGLYRVNRQGQFNTPYGYYANPKLCNEENLWAVNKLLQSADLMSGDYRAALKNAKKGDFIYLDPPYMPVSQYSDFKRYTKESFHEEDHVALAGIFRELSNRGCYVMLSNSNHPLVSKLYKGFYIKKVGAKRLINTNASKRGEVTELLIRNYV